MADLDRLLDLYQALDEATIDHPAPAEAAIAAAIADLAAHADRYGLTGEQVVADCRDRSAAFWQDWFAMEAVAARTGAAPMEVAAAVYYRELARRPEQAAPRAA